MNLLQMCKVIYKNRLYLQYIKKINNNNCRWNSVSNDELTRHEETRSRSTASTVPNLRFTAPHKGTKCTITAQVYYTMLDSEYLKLPIM